MDCTVYELYGNRAAIKEKYLLTIETSKGRESEILLNIIILGYFPSPFLGKIFLNYLMCFEDSIYLILS